MKSFITKVAIIISVSLCLINNTYAQAELGLLNTTILKGKSIEIQADASTPFIDFASSVVDYEWRMMVSPANKSFSLQSNLSGVVKTQLYFDNTGRLGLGTSSPQSQLHIRNYADALDIYSGIRMVPAANSTSYHTIFGFRALGLRLEGGSGATSSKTAAGITLNNTGIDFLTGDGTATMTSKMILLPNGNLGIGFATPTTKLYVNGSTYALTSSIGTTSTTPGYSLTVKGGIATDLVTVKTSTQWGWPDFVFEKNYKLRSLEEVKAFVEENKHLPEVPSTAEVTENGIDLGRMDAVLLQKIEELTLYLIKVNEENKELKNQMAELKKQIDLK